MEGFVFNTRRPIFAGLAGARRADPRVQLRVRQPDAERRRVAAAGELFRQLGARRWATGRRRGGCASCSSRSRTSLVPGALDAYALPVVGRVAAQPGEHADGGEAARGGGLDGAGRACCGTRRASRSPSRSCCSGAERGGGQHLRRRAAPARDRRRGCSWSTQAQYNERRNDYDYDMIVNAWNMSLSPGNEQTLYWGSAGRDRAGHAQLHGRGEPGGGGDDRRRCWRRATRRSSWRRCRRSTGC